MNESVLKYCKAKGIEPCEIINKCRRDDVLIRRNAFIYLAWENRKQTVGFDNPKSKVLTELGAEFNLSRVNVHERIVQFESELLIYRGHKKLLEEIKEVVNAEV